MQDKCHCNISAHKLDKHVSYITSYQVQHTDQAGWVGVVLIALGLSWSKTANIQHTQLPADSNK